MFALSILAFPPPAAARAPQVTTVTIAGNPVVGQRLTARVTVKGDPAAKVTYQWLRCNDGSPVRCDELIVGATAASYDAAPPDFGRRLAVRARAANGSGSDERRSPPTAGIRGIYDIATPYLHPFPVVRVKGRLVRGGARITRLRVTAPRESKVVVRCKGRGCPLRRKSVGVGRVRTLERFLRAGIRITIRVSSPGFVGKHVRLVIRDGRAPARRDACLLPGRPQPASCPPL